MNTARQWINNVSGANTIRMMVVAFALLLALLFPQRMLGQEWKFLAHNCAITPPHGWELITNLPPQPGLIAVFGNAPKTSVLIVLLDERSKPAGPMDEQFIAEFEKGVEQTGVGKRISGRFIEVAGHKAYERVGTASVNGRQASTIVYAVPAGGKFYSVQAMRFDGDASADPEIRKALASFRFLKPPSLLSQYELDAGRIGFRTGKSLQKILPAAGAVVLAIFLIRRAVIRRKKPPSVMPPPLPPTR